MDSQKSTRCSSEVFIWIRIAFQFKNRFGNQDSKFPKSNRFSSRKNPKVIILSKTSKNARRVQKQASEAIQTTPKDDFANQIMDENQDNLVTLVNLLFEKNVKFRRDHHEFLPIMGKFESAESLTR